LLLGFTFFFAAGRGQAASAPPPDALSAGQIVQRMEDRNQERAERLRGYTSDRRYHVEYRGFPATLAASMDVEVSYDAPASKRFRIVSQTGSGLLIDRVLKKLLKSEQDAAQDQSRSALTTENYNFALVGSEVDDGRQRYILHVEPKGNGKLLYRGKIWVDADDYAVARIEAEPAQNPSFWIRKTEIHHVYSKTGDFWLPASNRSVTKVRMGGTAILTIDYGTYRIGAPAASAHPLSENSSTQ
jgi:outer membrane lipoprotein-sorting protein